MSTSSRYSHFSKPKKKALRAGRLVNCSNQRYSCAETLRTDWGCDLNEPSKGELMAFTESSLNRMRDTARCSANVQYIAIPNPDDTTRFTRCCTRIVPDAMYQMFILDARTCFATSLRKRIWGKSVEEPETLGQFPQPRQYQTQDELHIFADLCMTGEQYEQSITVQPLHFWHSEAS